MAGPKLVLRVRPRPSNQPQSLLRAPLTRQAAMQSPEEADTIRVDQRPARKLGHPLRSLTRTENNVYRYEDDTEEYVLKPDDYPHDSEDNDLDDDDRSVITISSEPDPEPETFPLSNRPWVTQKWDLETRAEYERIFCGITTHPMQGTWEFTEVYQRFVDDHLLTYLEDYAFDQWAIGGAAARVAFENQVNRQRWRNLGVPIYVGTHPNGLGQQQQQQPIPLQYNIQPNPQVVMGGQVGRASVPGQHPQPPPRHHQPPVYQPPPHARIPAARAVQTDLRRSSGASGKRRASIVPTPPEPATPPPFPFRPRPAGKAMGTIKKRTVRGNAPRRHAEAIQFPWNRQFDFVAAKANASWDETKYDRKILDKMQAMRDDNAPTIDTHRNLQRYPRSQLPADKQTQALVDNSEGEDAGKDKSLAASHDASQSGFFSFATPQDQKRADALGEYQMNPEDMIELAESGDIDWEACKNVMIYWNPGKRGKSTLLKQARFRVYDVLITRDQMSKQKIWTRRAAECIIDFCPDMLWRETLLRMQCEAGMQNKEMCSRYTANGCWADPSTFTKRIQSALGQKSTGAGHVGFAPKKANDAEFDSEATESDGRDTEAPDEHTWWRWNQEDQRKYAEFFGHLKIGHRSIPIGQRKRPGGNDPVGGSERGAKRARLAADTESDDCMVVSSKPIGTAPSQDEDAASVQESDILDAMDAD